MKQLILAEKPSVAKNIADALDCKNKKDGYYENESYIITWAFGHLLSLFDVKDYDKTKASWRMENFPFIPSVFEYKIKPSMKDRNKPDYGAKKQLDIITRQIRRDDVSSIISACDYDREGQIIGDIIFKYIKPNKQTNRMLLNEWTKAGVLKGLEQLKSNEEMIPLRDAGISRQWADWIIGINLTSVATLKYQNGGKNVLNIGRVLLPTLKIIYDRDILIRDFVPEEYHKLSALFLSDDIAFEGIYFIEKKDKFETINELEEILKHVNWPNSKGNLKGEIIKKEVKRKKEYPPFLFNLSNLQGYITSKFSGFTSTKVLKIAQSLYEKKYITYPRTSSLALEESLVDSTRKIVELLKQGLPYENEIEFKENKRVFDNKKVESHSAIIPTYVIPKNLSDDEWKVYFAVKNRLLMQFMPIAEYEETKLITRLINDLITDDDFDKSKDLLFHSSGRVQIVDGWKIVEHNTKPDRVLPLVNKNDVINVRELNIISNATKPPKYHTEKTLLKIMETCGKNYKDDQSEEMIKSVLSGFSIGTAATRADTISKLVRVGYIETSKKNLITTSLGRQLVESFPIKELLDLEYTGRLEKQLSDISKGDLSKNVFLRSIFAFTADSVRKIKEDRRMKLVAEQVSVIDTLGNCPECSGQIFEGKKGFGCTRWKEGCKFVIWKEDKFFVSMKKKPTKTIVKSLLKNKKALVKGFVGKSGNKFDAYVKYEKKEGSNHYTWSLEWLNQK